MALDHCSVVGSNPDTNHFEAWADMYDQYQKVALTSRLGIPLIYGVDAVHGHNNVLGATIFPHNVGLGCANDYELCRKISEATAIEVAATGINWNFSPCLAIPPKMKNGEDITKVIVNMLISLVIWGKHPS